MAREMGKPLVEGRAEASKCAWVCRYFAQGAEDLLRPREAVWRRFVEPRWIEDSMAESISQAVDVVLWHCVSFEIWRQRHGWSNAAAMAEPVAGANN